MLGAICEAFFIRLRLFLETAAAKAVSLHLDTVLTVVDASDLRGFGSSQSAEAGASMKFFGEGRRRKGRVWALVFVVFFEEKVFFVCFGRC